MRQAVDHFAASTGLPEELNSTELDALMARVLEEMEIFCKHDHIENITDPQAFFGVFVGEGLSKYGSE